MGDWISYLRELNMASLLLRLILAMLCGGLLGLERGRQASSGRQPYLYAGMSGRSVDHGAQPV